MPLKLFGYFRSSAAYRVRIALKLKGLDWESESVPLTRDGGKQFGPAYRSINPQALVPTIKDGPTYITQSLAIIEYLEETYPETPLLPKSRKARARVRALALSVACDIHPLNNLRVLKYLTDTLGVEESTRMDWYRYWISTGLSALEAMLVDHPNTGSFCHGDSPGLADACLVPQIFNASRFDCDLSTYPTILRINKKCLKLDTFRTAAPENQPDAE